MDFPKSLDVLEAARALSVSTRTISNLVGKPHNKANHSVSFLALCRAVKCEPRWLMDCLEGRGRAATVAKAATVMGLNERQIASTAHALGLVKPAAMPRKGWRYSAK